jgi:hypothetical protein
MGGESESNRLRLGVKVGIVILVAPLVDVLDILIDLIEGIKRNLEDIDSRLVGVLNHEVLSISHVGELLQPGKNSRCNAPRVVRLELDLARKLLGLVELLSENKVALVVLGVVA